MNNKVFLGVLAVLAIGGAITGLTLGRGDKSELSQIETASGETPAAGSTASAIAVVDIQQLMRESSAAKSLESEVKSMREDFEKEITAAEKSLRTQEKALVESRKTLKEDEFKAKRDAFEKQVRSDQEKMQKRRAELEGMIAGAVEKLRTKIVEIVADVSKANNFNLVLSRSDIVLVSESMNVTAQVMDKLNAAMPNLSAKDTPATNTAATKPTAPEAAPAVAAPADAQPAAGGQ